ncbi:MAG: nuclear transport factor 2 family protein [Erythrobacter sp.]
MANLEQDFEVLENRLMRAWMHRDAHEAKSLIASDFISMFGTNPPVLLDRASFVGGIQDGLRCEGFRFHEVTARRHGRCVWFTGHIELELRIDQRDWRGHFLLTDLWRKGRVQRRWKLAERSLALADDNRPLSDAIRGLQLWR